MEVNIIYFARVREQVGRESDRLVLPDSVTTPAALLTWLAARDPACATAFGDHQRIRCAVDQVMVALDAPFGTAHEIALFPPVTGG